MGLKAVPQLSVEGYVTNKNIIMMKLYEHFLASDYSQSNIFLHKVESLKFIISEHSNPYDLKSNITSALTRLYERYFKNVEVLVDVDVGDSNNQLYIDVTCVDDDGVRYTLSRTLEEVDGKILSFDKLAEEMHE